MCEDARRRLFWLKFNSNVYIYIIIVMIEYSIKISSKHKKRASILNLYLLPAFSFSSWSFHRCNVLFLSVQPLCNTFCICTCNIAKAAPAAVAATTHALPPQCRQAPLPLLPAPPLRSRSRLGASSRSPLLSYASSTTILAPTFLLPRLPPKDQPGHHLPTLTLTFGTS